jgi:DNA-binding XRE family transcriptional regulator
MSDNKYTPNPKFQGDNAALNRLEEAINSAIARNPKLAIVYDEETLQIKLAGLLYGLRKENGVSQDEFAKMAGLTQPFIARIENPTSAKKPSLKTLAKIAYGFNKRLVIEFEDIDIIQRAR